jgi:hypothetical protein
MVCAALLARMLRWLRPKPPPRSERYRAVPLNEVGFQPGLLGKASRDIERYAREIEPSCHRAASHETERVAPDRALQMEDALSGNVAKFGGFDGMESVLTCAKPSSM